MCFTAKDKYDVTLLYGVSTRRHQRYCIPKASPDLVKATILSSADSRSSITRNKTITMKGNMQRPQLCHR